MTGESVGREWTGADLAVVVGDYVAQLEKTLAGKPVDRATHDRAVRFVTGKSDMPISWKQGEISAVLSLIGLPTLKDMPPRWSYDEALLEAVEAQLAAKPTLLAVAVRPAALFAAPPAIPLIEAAPPKPMPMPMDEQLIRVIQRFDMSGREADDRFLRGLGVASVVAHEARRLAERGRPDLADEVRPTNDRDPEGCDVIGFGLDERPRLLVVKTTLAGDLAPFSLTQAEYALSDAQPDAFRVRRVYDLLGEARFYRLKPPFA
ncbi:hypothetical protein [Caulobacter sp. RL271]|jgi:hypothetical protein|uniref:Protein NO VEIN C-terminal domain-containing protein n=1 Tax=Caulobacter segnis TaxID=88688 RepID=A0ABY5A0D1_9CAUL|nr:hypothetical protein [Caulobacter segnis]USQ98535.1 hypothetical protein MZV50_07895 [Caulobacter segnis]